MANPSTSEVVCWSCQGPIGKSGSFCETCGAVQPPRSLDVFARLDLTPGFDLELPALDQLYFKRQRLLHPDRFRARTAREQAFAQAQAADLNDAYETLRDPVARAVALLKLAGRAIDDADGVTVQDKALLLEAMEAREALAEAEDLPAVDAVAARAKADAEGVVRDLSVQFQAGDLDLASRSTLRLKYLRKLAEEARLRRRRFAVAA